MGKNVLFVAAHPDDETFSIAGSIALHQGDPDLRFTLVIATDGEAGEIAPDVDVDHADLGAHRRIEDAQSWEVLGRPPDRHEWLGFRDGSLQDEMGALTERIAEFLRQERPDVVGTFGPDGVTGHPDHVAISEATTSAFRIVLAEGVPLGRLIYTAIPLSSIEMWNQQRAAHGLELWDASKPYHLRGVPDETIGIVVDTSSVADTLVRAVRTHRSQWSYLTVDNDRPLARGFRRESWVVHWPSMPSGVVLRDIFE